MINSQLFTNLTKRRNKIGEKEKFKEKKPEER